MTGGVTTPADIRQVARAIAAARDRARLTLIAQRALVLIAIAVAAILAGAALDYALRFPAWLRTLGLLAAIAALGWGAWRFVLPAWRFRPSLTTVALRLERQRPEYRGLLASALEFAEAQIAAPPSVSSRLASRVVDAARAAFDAKAAAAALSTRQLGRSGAQFAIAAVIALGAFIASPRMLSIGITRILAPWAGVEWPRRTGVADVTLASVHPRGAALPLRAAVTRSVGEAEDTDVRAEYRLIASDGRAGPIRTALLTAQSRDIAIPRDRAREPGVERGALFERLVEADAAGVEYRFRTADDETPWRTVRVVDPPAVVGARASLSPPAYAAGLASAAGSQPFGPRPDVDLGPGRDERASAPPALAGSSARLVIRFNKPLPAPPSDAEARASWLASTLGKDASALTDITIETAPGNAEWTLAWTLDKSVRFTPRLADEFGITSIEESAYRFEAVADREPGVSITEPAADTAVLPTATVDVAAEARDDVALRALWVERVVAAPAGAREPSGPGGALEPGEPAEIARVDAGDERSAKASARVDLAPLGLAPGQELWLTALASDIFATDAGARPPVRSATRKLRIISENDLIEEIRRELSAVRQSAIRVDAQQGDLMDQTRLRGSDRRTRGGQSQVSERLTRQQEALQRLADRAQRNNLDDRRLQGLLEDAAASTRRAGQSSAQAAQTLDQAAANQREGEQGSQGKQGENQRPDPDAAAALSPAQAKAAEERQQQVREELGRLIEALDAGQDSWVARRQIEQLVKQQSELRDDTKRLAAATAGAAAERLTPQQKSDLEKITEKQRELAEQARKVTDELPEKARQLRRNDPNSAAGLEQAARKAQQAQTPKTMERAANQAQQNQANDAVRSQEQALKDLKDVLDEMERGERSRQEQLRRQIASLIQSLEGLIARQEAELARLDAAERADKVFTGLDQGMIALSRQTLGVLDQAHQAGRELREVASLIARASEAQGKAVEALRARSVDAAIARGHENDSLARLQEAKAKAEQAEEDQADAENQRKRGELRKAYAEILQRQQDARAQAARFAEIAELSRRDRATVRAVGEEQTAIRSALSELLAKTAELSETGIFEYAHKRLDAFTARASDRLRASEPAPALPDQDRAIATLQQLLRSLQEDPRQRKKDEFADGQAGGQSGQGGNQQQAALIPPIAQLVLLREMQAGLLTDTRAAAARPAPDALAEIADQQMSLADLGKAIVDKMQRRGGPDRPTDVAPPIKPGPPPGQGPEPKPQGGPT